MKNSMCKIKNRASKSLLSISLMVSSIVSYAAPQGEDIMKTFLNGTLGKTMGKDGMIWAVLTGASFLVGGFWATVKHDPKAFIPAFFIAAIISTVVGAFITY